MLRELARQSLRLVPREAAVPVLSGPNRAMRWIVGAGIHSCWRGTYEQEKIAIVLNSVRPGMTIFDVGAHAGYYTLAFSRAVGPTGRVVAFEPSPVNIANLRRHLHLNAISNVEIIEAAASDREGSAHFALSNAPDARDQLYGGGIAKTGFPVRTVRLDGVGMPDLIKMDIEGGEGLALVGAERILATGCVPVFVALHRISDELARAELTRHGYSLVTLDHDDEVFAAPRQTAVA